VLALDRLSVYATATRYPSPTGRLPRVPDQARLESEIGAVSDLPQILSWHAAAVTD
jgi:hypothetical protein